MGQEIPIVVSRGNHDGNHPYAFSYINNPSPSSSWFAFSMSDLSGSDNSSTRIVVLDSNWELGEELAVRHAQTEWLRHELSSENAQNAACLVVLLHIGPFIEYWEKHVYAEENSVWGDYIRSHWVPLFEKYKVDLVVSGHSHVYQRGERNGVTYIILGGGGGTLDQEKAADLQIFKKTEIAHHYGVLGMDLGRFSVSVFNQHDKMIDYFRIAT